MTERAFEILEAIAVAGGRCPITSGPEAHREIKSAHISSLAREGRIAVEISSKNWRRVTILIGPNAGKSTAANPHKGNRVYQTIDTRGTMVNGKHVDHGAASRRQPSAPRFLTKEELLK